MVRTYSECRPEGPMRLPSFDIRSKLAGLVFALAGVVVVALTMYFSSRQATAAEAALRAKAMAFVRLLSHDAQSAVAFDDRQTARELVESAAQDPDVQAVLLLGPDDAVLGAVGEPITRPAEMRLESGDGEPIVVQRQSVIAVSMLVLTKEGPRGSLLVELSTKSITREKTKIRNGAIVAGLVALFGGLLASWVIGRSFAARIRRIQRATLAFGDGVRDVERIADTSQDEIGVLARTFDGMALRIRELVTRIESQGREQAERLDRLVVERTAELREKNADLAFVLDNVGQGFLTVGRSGGVTRRQSAVLSRWFPGVEGDPPVWDLVASRDKDAGGWLAVGWETVFDDSLPLELAIDQLPKQVRCDDTTLGLRYQPILNHDQVEKVIVVITDVSDEIARQRAEATQKEFASVFARLVSDPRCVQQFLVEGGALVRALCHLAADDTSLVDQKRWLHTLKGNAGFLGLTRLRDQCHQMETLIVESARRPPAESRASLRRMWEELSTSLGPFVSKRVHHVELSRQQVLDHVDSIHRGRPRAVLASVARGWLLEGVDLPLKRAAEQARTAAEKLGKDGIDVSVEAGDLRVDPATWGPFWSAFVHVVRNAVDHGIEDADERARAGKPSGGTIVLRATQTPTEDVIEVQDDGRGIDWSALERRARELGIPFSPDERDALVFVDGLSSKAQVSEVSGRGVGLGASRAAAMALGGRVEVTSTLGVGTIFRFRVPRSRPSILPRAS